MGFSIKLLDSFPTSCGVYLMKDVDRRILYIGKAKNLRQRLKQYFIPGRDERTLIPFLTPQIHSIDTIVLPTEQEALLLENTLIKQHQPKYNILLKDDKTFISLLVTTQHPWPMVKLIRCKGKPRDKGVYFGPYSHAQAARETLDLIARLFPLRQCSDEELKRRSRPCILYSMKRCIAPCVDLCSKEEYSLFVDSTIRFLKGQDKEILPRLYADMHQASSDLEFERAAALLKTIRQIEQIVQEPQTVAKTTIKDCDVLGLYREDYHVVLVQLFWREGKLAGSEYYRFDEVAQDDDELLSSFILQHSKFESDRGINKKGVLLAPISTNTIRLLESLCPQIAILHPKKGDKFRLLQIAKENAHALFVQKKDEQSTRERILIDLVETLHLSRYPQQIECFDTSNTSGTEHVACMIGFTNGEKNRKKVRFFRIKHAVKGDDYGAMKEAMTRRLIKAKEEEDLPDLIIVDGGKGQLSAALEVFKELDIASVDVIALAKEQARHDKGLTLERVFLPGHADAIHLSARSPLLFFLQKIRDEAHRLAISFHRKRRSKESLSSSLDSLSGIGPVKRSRLLRHFGSIKKIKEASEEELAQVKGLTKQDLLTLKKFSH